MTDIAMPKHRVTVIGAGIAGTEAVWQLASRGVDVRLIEVVRPKPVLTCYP